VAFRAVIFDIGGVLEINPRTGWQERWAARLGIDLAELNARLDPVWGGGDVGAVGLEDVERGIARELALDIASLRAFMADLWDEYLGRLNVELTRYFAALRPRYRTGILSNSFVGAREREQEAYGFEDLCDVLVYSHEEGMKKPDRRLYELVCRRLRVAPAEAIFVDDVEDCVEGARRAGLTAIRFRNNVQAIAKLNSLLELG
jgi:putative hydrolase of the HAD superfamily